MQEKMLAPAACLGAALLLITNFALASDWTHWRGPSQNGSSPETGLISDWSPDGKNLIWRASFTSRSTPIIMNGKVYVTGRAGAEIDKQESVACFDAESGKLLWERRNPVYNTAVPFQRVSWASPAGDPETGNVYTIGGGGLFQCFDENGKRLWYRNMTDEFNVITGYGGRTVTPIVDEDQVIIAFVSSSWGNHAAPFMRYYAFDKRSGAVRWISAPGGRFTNPNIYSTPVVAVINGERLLVGGNADGNVYALKVRTGEKVWEYQFSKRGLHASVVVEGNIVYAAHGEENYDTQVMGRVVAIDGTGSGDITKTHELWRIDGMEVGYTSLLYHDSTLYYVDNSANLYAVDAKNGKQRWMYNMGTVGKASPVWADGKIYYPEVNGRFQILKPSATGCEELSQVNLTMPDGRYMELYGSPAIAYGRIYFTTEEGVYCLGDKSRKFSFARAKMAKTDWKAPAGAKPAYLQLVPAEITALAGQKVTYRARALDEKRRFISEVKPEWNLGQLAGTIDKAGVYTAAVDGIGQVGMLTASHAGLTAQARARVFADLPWQEDFEAIAVDANRPYWLGAGSANSPATKFIVKELDGNMVLNKPISERGVQRGVTYIGAPGFSNYTIQVDVMSEKDKRRISDIGVINSGYTLELMGAKQEIEVRAWISELRIAQNVRFRWEGETWYTIKFRVDNTGEKSLVRGKVWPKGEAEPEAWAITVEDPHPIREGAPGLYGFTKTNIYFDNVKITRNETSGTN